MKRNYLLFFLLSVFVVWGLPQISRAAIAFDAASSNGTTAATASPSIWSHAVTGTGTSTVLIVGCSVTGAGLGVSAVSYGGAALTKIRDDIDTTAGAGTSEWYIKNPAPGTNNISVTWTGSGIFCGAISLTGVDQTNPLDANAGTGTTEVTASPISQAITTVANNAWVVDVVNDRGSGVAQLTAGGNQTRRVSQMDPASATGNAIGMSTRGAVTPAGSITNTWSTTDALPGMTLSEASFKPAGTSSQSVNPPSAPTNVAAIATSPSQINLSWNAPAAGTNPITGYQIFRGATQIGTTTATNYPDTGLTPSTPYSYTVKAYDTAGFVSAPSAAAGATTLASASTLPNISNVQSSGMSSSGALITWLTDIPSDSQVDYGLTAAYGSTSALFPSPATNHSVSLSSLLTATLYHYRVKSNNNGNLSVSADNTFSTAASGSTSASTSSPIIFFTDLESGPNTGGENNNGVFVTIYGQNFGSNPSVTVGGGPAIIKSTPSPWMWYQKMTIQLGASAASGNIVVTTGSGSSNGMPFTVRTGNIFCVSPTGNDAGAGTFGSGCWRSTQHAVDVAAPGDTIYLRQGVVEDHQAPAGSTFGSVLIGQSGANGSAVCNGTANPICGGTPGNPIALVGYPGETATIGGTGTGMCNTSTQGCHNGIETVQGVGHNYRYWTISNLTLRGQQYGIFITGYGEAAVRPNSTNFRIIGNDASCPFMNSPSFTYCMTWSQTDNVVTYGNSIHDVGTSDVNPPSPEYNGALYDTTDSNHAWIAWNSVYNIAGARGIQIHSSPLGAGDAADPTGKNQFDIHIHDNLVHDVTMDGILFATPDPSLGIVEAYNNVVYNAGKGPCSPAGSPCSTGYYSGIYVGVYDNLHNGTVVACNSGPCNVDVYNNTLYNDGAETATAQAGIGWGGAIANNASQNSAPNVKIRARNNLVYQPTAGEYYWTMSSPSTECSTTCNNIYGNNNLFFGIGATPANPNITATIGSNPLLVNPAGQNFHLQSGSPAIGAGVAIANLATDFDGGYRAPGPLDLGAYAYATGIAPQPTIDTTPPSVPASLTAMAASSSSISLSWAASTDPDNTASQLVYKIFRNSIQVAMTAPGVTAYQDIGLIPATLYSYTVSVSDPAGNVSAQSTPATATTLALPPPPAPTISSFVASPASITVGSSAVLSFTVSGSPTSLSINRGIGSVLGSNSITVSPTTTTTYTLTASNAGGTASAQATVAVGTMSNPPSTTSTAPIIVSFTANPASLTSGAKAILSWVVSSTPAAVISLDNGIGTLTGSSTSLTVAPTQATTYTLSATNAAGTATAQAIITVTAAPSNPASSGSGTGGNGGVSGSVSGGGSTGGGGGGSFFPTTPAITTSSTASVTGTDLQALYQSLLATVNSLMARLNYQLVSQLTHNLAVGSNDPSVRALQIFLNNNGYIVAASGPGSPGNESNYFGVKTAAALAKYQSSVGLPPTGVLGRLTRAYLQATWGGQ